MSDLDADTLPPLLQRSALHFQVVESCTPAKPSLSAPPHQVSKQRRLNDLALELFYAYGPIGDAYHVSGRTSLRAQQPRNSNDRQLSLHHKLLKRARWWTCHEIRAED